MHVFHRRKVFVCPGCIIHKCRNQTVGLCGEHVTGFSKLGSVCVAWQFCHFAIIWPVSFRYGHLSSQSCLGGSECLCYWEFFMCLCSWLGISSVEVFQVISVTRVTVGFPTQSFVNGHNTLARMHASQDVMSMLQDLIAEVILWQKCCMCVGPIVCVSICLRWVVQSRKERSRLCTDWE
jgi:hypothetical protein